MESSQNNQINFKTTLINTELGEKLARFKILTEFLSTSLVYCYQTAYGSKNFTQEEYDIINSKYREVKDIVDDTLVLALDLLPTDSEKTNLTEDK